MKQGPLAIFVVFLGVIVDKYKDVPPLYVTLFDDTSSIMFPMKPLNQKDDENKREIFVIRNGCKYLICLEMELHKIDCLYERIDLT